MRAMTRRIVLLLGLATLLAGCGSQEQPPASMPPAPQAPPGWTSIGTFGGQSGGGMVGAGFEVDLSQEDVAISAACTGDGTLAIFVGLETLSVSAAEVPAAVFRCTASADAQRVELTDHQLEHGAFSAAFIESAGGLRREAFNVSVEVRED